MPPEDFSLDERRPCFKKLDDGRVPVPVQLVPAWAKGQKPADLCLVPLTWRRELEGLPSANRLDCWYLWRSADVPTAEWSLDPRPVMDQKIDDPETLVRLQLLVFKAEIKLHKKQHRLECATLLGSLAARSDDYSGGVWIVPECEGSISIWANIAFQLYHGQTWSAGESSPASVT